VTARPERDAPEDVAGDYTRLAARYAEELADELDAKPLDRALLAALVEQTHGLGPIADLGCGPGHVSAHLAGLGAKVVGIDLSPGMIAIAQSREPTLEFRIGDLRELPVGDGECGGIVAFYSLIHLSPSDRAAAYREMHRVLAPAGRALIAFHIGDEVVHPGELWGIPIGLGFRFLQVDDVADGLTGAGLTIEARLERLPHEGTEHPSRRAYLIARRLPDTVAP
jgi:SAM-dependent methyltransferase